MLSRNRGPITLGRCPKPRGKKIIANTPVHRFGEPEEIVGTMLYLLSDISAFVTGIIIPVDGGYSAFGGV